MLEVRIPKEITDYQEKIFFGLSARKALCTVVALALALLVAYVGYQVLWLEIYVISPLIFLVVAPIWAFGFLRPMNLPMEVYAKYILQHIFARPKLRYETNLPKFKVDENFPIIDCPTPKSERKKHVKSLQKEDRKRYKKQSERTTGRI